MQEFVNSLHFGTRFLLIFMVVIFLIQFLLLDSSIQGLLTFCPRLIVEKFQLWRLITGAFLHGGILHLCMNMLSFTQLGLTFESHVGTLSYFYHIIIFGLISSTFHTLIAFIMYIGGDSSQWSSSAVGFSGILFALIVVDITISGGDQRSILGLFLVPSWLYPWAMLLIMSLLIPNVSFLGHLSGIIAGYLYQFNILRFVTPPIRFFSSIERKCCCCCLNRLGYISAEGVGGGRPWAVFQHAFQDDNDADNATQINHFNGQGRTLGVTPDNTNIQRNNNNDVNNNPFSNQQGRTIGQQQNEESENVPLENIEINLSDIDKDDEKPDA